MKYRTIQTVLLLVTVWTISACGTAEAPTEETANVVTIALGSMKRDVVEHTYLTIGEVIPNKQVDLYIQGSGYIEEVNTETGALVEKGMLLVQLDDSDLDMTNYNATESQLRTVRDNLSSRLTSLQDTYERQQALFEEGIITFTEVDQTRVQIGNLERELANARVAYSNQLTILRDGLEDAVDARVMESPVSGLVAAVYVKEGQGANGQKAMTIIDDSRLFVRTYVSGDLKRWLSPGDYVRIREDGDEALLQMGTIHEIQSLPDMTTKLFEVLIEVADPESYVIGDYAEVEFIAERYEALLVPTQALIRKGEEAYVYLYGSNGVEEILIETGRTSGEWMEVTNLEEISQVVVRGQNQLTVDSVFKVVEY